MPRKSSRELTDVLLTFQKKYKPSKKIINEAIIKDYNKILKQTARNPIKFWEQAAGDLEWFHKWDKVFDDSQKPFFITN